MVNPDTHMRSDDPNTDTVADSGGPGGPGPPFGKAKKCKRAP